MEIMLATGALTAGQLLAELSKVPTGTWLCCDGGPVNSVRYEPGANEPFVVLEYKSEITGLYKPPNPVTREERVKDWLSAHSSLAQDDWEMFATMLLGLIRAEIERAVELDRTYRGPAP